MNVADLLRRPGSTREVHLEVPLAGLASPSSRVESDEPLTIVLRLESLSSGIVASGSVRGRWRAVCSRCLRPVDDEFRLSFREVFEQDPVEEETYLLMREEIDLEQALRDLIVPELPAVPRCADECSGLCPECGANRNDDPCSCAGKFRDPRWDALRAFTTVDDSHHRPDPN